MTTSIAELVSAHPFLAGLSDEQRALVVGCAWLTGFNAGTLVLAEGGEADTFYLLRSGHVAIEAHQPGRGPLVIETVGPGGVVGWSWLVPPYRWTFDARAKESVTAIAFDGACLRQKSGDDPALGFALLSKVAAVLLERLQATRWRLLDLYGES